MPGAADESLLIKPAWVDRTAFLDRLFRRITVVHPGEGFGALMLGLNLFLLLGAFALLKTVREALILQQGGAEVKSYAAAAQSLVLLLAVPLYGLIASRMDRVRLIVAVNTFFLTHLLAFWAAGRAGLRIDVPFYLWLGVFNVMVIAQAWAFATDVYSEEQGKRLFGIVGLGSTLGALAGARLSRLLFAEWGPHRLLLLAALLLALSLFVTWLVNKFVCECGGPQSVIAQLPIGRQGGFRLLRQDRYLLLVAVLALLVNLLSTSGDFLLGKLVVAEAQRLHGAGADAAGLRQRWIGDFYADFLTASGLLGFLLQLLVVSRLFRWVGPAGALLVLPFLFLGSSALLLFAPALLLAQATRLIETGVEYSVQGTAGHALLLGTSRETKYKAKAAIDTFFWRTGDLVQAGVVYAGTSLGFGIPQYAAVNLALVSVSGTNEPR